MLYFCLLKQILYVHVHISFIWYLFLKTHFNNRNPFLRVFQKPTKNTKETAHSSRTKEFFQLQANKVLRVSPSKGAHLAIASRLRNLEPFLDVWNSQLQKTQNPRCGTIPTIWAPELRVMGYVGWYPVPRSPIVGPPIGKSPYRIAQKISRGCIYGV